MKINEIKKGSTYAMRQYIERTNYSGSPLNTSWDEIEVLDILPLNQAQEKYGKKSPGVKKWNNPTGAPVYTLPTGPAIAGGAKVRVVVARRVRRVYMDSKEPKTRMYEDEPVFAMGARNILGEASEWWGTKLAEVNEHRARLRGKADSHREAKARKIEIVNVLTKHGLSASVSITARGHRRDLAGERYVVRVEFEGDKSIGTLLGALEGVPA